MAVKSPGAHHNAYFNGDYNLLLNKVHTPHNCIRQLILRQQVALLSWSSHLYGINKIIIIGIKLIVNMNMITEVYKYTILTRTVL